MNRKQRIAIGAPPLLVLSMLALYRLLARRLEARKAWYAGFPVYWSVWCIAFPLWLLGFKDVKVMFAYRHPRTLDWLMLIAPPVLSVIGRRSSRKEPHGTLERTVLVLTALMNGTLEEVLWRGVYVALFPKNPVWGEVYPTLWFAL